MRIAILGTGAVGRRLAEGFNSLGHEVMLTARSADNGEAADWARAFGGRSGSFAGGAEWCELAVVAVRGEHAVSAVGMAGPGALTGKIVVDVTNPLDFSRGFPPFLTDGMNNTTSVGEAVQAALPGSSVVKTLNTVSNLLMTEPGRVAGPHDLFICGNDAAAKARVAGLLAEFGWGAPIDLGGIEAARATEAWLLLWTRLYGALGTADFNLRLVRND
ncbi:MAG: hypothetical protein RLZZ528_1574 [Pseudomonadota bacterium]|jgi:predicted dinucleotide-binding enzyme